MKIKFIKLIVIFLLVSFASNAQDKSLIARSEYISAEEAYGQGNYNKCLTHLKTAEDMVGNNRAIQYLRVKSYYGLKEYIMTKEELEVFFKITPKNMQILKNTGRW